MRRARSRRWTAVGRREENANDTERQNEAGIQTIKFEGADGKAYLAKAYEAGWAGVIKQSPEHGPKLKEFFAKAQVSAAGARGRQAPMERCRAPTAACSTA